MREGRSQKPEGSGQAQGQRHCLLDLRATAAASTAFCLLSSCLHSQSSRSKSAQKYLPYVVKTLLMTLYGLKYIECFAVVYRA